MRIAAGVMPSLMKRTAAAPPRIAKMGAPSAPPITMRRRPGHAAWPSRIDGWVPMNQPAASPVEANSRPFQSLLARHAMPEEWRCVLAIPAADAGLSGRAEEEAFARIPPDPERAAAIAHVVLTALLPALVERDLGEFGAALTRLQRLVGDAFAAVQGGPFHPRAGALVDALLRLGAAGAGQSSWGPAVYGLAGSEQEGRELARRLAPELGGGRVDVVRFDDRGARLEVA